MTNYFSRITRVFSSHLNQAGERSYTALALAVFSLLFFGFFGLKPLLTHIAFLRSELKSGGAYEAALTEKIAALSKGKENLAQITDKIEAINKAIPDGPAQAELIEELSVDGGKTGFSLTGIFFRGGEIKNGIGSESFECSLQGSSAGLIPFLEEIAKGRLVMIGSIRYSQRMAGMEKTIEVTLRGESFYYERSE